MPVNASRPADFAVLYVWQAGSMPPPYHHEFSIHISPQAEGKIVFHPDYPSDTTPRWSETFSIPGEILDELYALVQENDLTRKKWPEDRAIAIGGSQDWIKITADGDTTVVPSRASKDERVSSVYAFIRDLVPEAIWTSLKSRRERYVREYETREE
jgi:hypothetical protein